MTEAEKVAPTRDDLPLVSFGDTSIPGHKAKLRSALDELASAEFEIRLTDTTEPVDYLAEVAIDIDGERAWSGTATAAEPSNDFVHVRCASGVSMTEGLVGAMASEQCPVMDLAYAMARSGGFAEENIVISHLEDLPLETIEVLVAVQGVEVDARRRVGAVSLIPPVLARSALDSFKVDPPPRLLDAFEAADCFAAIYRTDVKLWDAERSALAELDVSLGWLAVRARYGLARLPSGRPQRYERRVTRSLPTRGEVMMVRGLGTGRRWIRDPATLTDRPPLPLDEARGQLGPGLPSSLNPADRLALTSARRAFDGTQAERIVALWEAWELYAGGVSLPKRFTPSERERLTEDLPPWLSEDQRTRLKKLFKLLNARPLAERLKAALDKDQVDISNSEWKVLWSLRGVRNDAAHGRSADLVDEGDLELACSLLARALVTRLSRGKVR